MGLALLLGKAVLAALLSRERYVLLKPALDPSRPLPHAYDYFALTLERVPLGYPAPQGNWGLLGVRSTPSPPPGSAGAGGDAQGQLHRRPQLHRGGATAGGGAGG